MLSAEAQSVCYALIIQVPLLLFHVSVDVCILRQLLRDNAAFSKGFYTLYLCQSFSDIGNFLVVTIMQLSRLDAFLSEELYLNPIRLRIGFAAVNYCLCFQVVSHLYIAINRYSVIARPLAHNSPILEQIWTGTRLRWMVLSLFLLPLPCAALYVIQPMYAVTMNNPDGTRIHAPRSPLATLATVTTSTSAAYNVFTALLSIILELQTLFTYKGMNEVLKKSRKEDYRLLLYALCQFVGQFLMTLYFVIILTNNVASIPGLLSAARLSYSYVIDVLCFTGPICLFFTSKTLRLHYMKMFACDCQSVTKVSFFKQSTESR